MMRDEGVVDVVGGRREVRIEPMVATTVSAYPDLLSASSFRRKGGRPTGPIQNARSTPNAQNPSQSLSNRQAVQLTSLPLSISSTSSLAASGPSTNKGVRSSTFTSLTPAGRGGRTRMKSAEKRLMVGEKMPRKMRNLVAFSSCVGEEEGVRKVGR